MVLKTDKDLNVSSIQVEQSQKCWNIPAGIPVTEQISFKTIIKYELYQDFNSS